ncbi:MAG: hypothetical protein WC761_02180 [Candidatus Paceibacterota bacterium]|jgi:hypothetical protein
MADDNNDGKPLSIVSGPAAQAALEDALIQASRDPAEQRHLEILQRLDTIISLLLAKQGITISTVLKG